MLGFAVYETHGGVAKTLGCCDVEVRCLKDIIDFVKSWDIYSIASKETPIHGIKLRGRIRKLAIAQEIEPLVEKATDAENTGRFAIESGSGDLI